jgi:hypothetical protein
MSLNPHLWESLEAHGVAEEHLELLLRLLALQKNGSWTWHFQHGSLWQCDVRLTFAARRTEVTRVVGALEDGNNVP